VLIRRVADAYGINDVTLEEPDLEAIIRRIYVEGYAPGKQAAPGTQTPSAAAAVSP
jgi:hypothetical protein